MNFPTFADLTPEESACAVECADCPAAILAAGAIDTPETNPAGLRPSACFRPGALLCPACACAARRAFNAQEAKAAAEYFEDEAYLDEAERALFGPLTARVKAQASA